MDKVSIITSTFNKQDYIDDLYQAVVKQTYPNWEWLITDDASNDGTYENLLRLASHDNRLILFRNGDNMGAAVSRNKCIASATGRYHAFLDADDLWYSEKLTTQIQFMKELNLAISFTSYEIINDAGERLGKKVDVNVPSEISYEDLLLKKATFGCSTVVIDAHVIGGYAMPLIRTGQDYATWLSLLKRGHIAHRLNSVLTLYRISPNSISRNKLKKAIRQWCIYRNIEKLGFLTSTVCFVNYGWRALFRR